MKYLKNLFFLIITLCLFLIMPVSATPSKVTALNYDDSSALVYIHIEEPNDTNNTPIKFIKLENPNRIYFDINNSVLVGSKQQLAFEKSNIKEIRLAQFSTNPDTVRVVVTFAEGFDTTNIKILNVNGNIIIKAAQPKYLNDYFNNVYDEMSNDLPYSDITASSQVVQKSVINTNSIDTVNNTTDKNKAEIINDIYKAFSNSTLNNSDGKSYDSVISIDISSDLKLRTKYFINGYYLKNGGLLVSGLGQIGVSKIFTLDSPKRIVIDLPNTYVDKRIRNKDLLLCPDGSCSDSAKIGQFEYNKARIVVTTDSPQKYIPVFSADSQSMLLINANKLNHTTLSGNTANIQQAYTKKISNKTGELILSFTSPVVYSMVRTDNMLTVYMFNVKSYNEPELIKALNGTNFKTMTFSLLPQIGVKADIKIKKDDIIQIAQGVDGRALKFIITSQKEIKNAEPIIPSETEIKPKKSPIKDKVVLDPGHGGTDYGAIREGINEKDLTLDLTKRVAALLKSKGYKVVLTRDDDIYLGLQERCDITEAENPEIFVSIHVNSAVATEPYGLETHYYHEQSKELAEIIQKHMVQEINNTKDRGILKSKFYVINHTDVPAVLVETGFLSNPNERADIITDKRKKATAKAISDGIIEYLKHKK